MSNPPQTPGPTPEPTLEPLPEPSPELVAERARKSMSEAIILMEQAAARLAGVQRTQDIQKAPLHIKLSIIMEQLNTELSVPEDKRDHALSLQTQSMLKNMRIKSNLSSFLALQAQIQRLSNITRLAGEVDRALMDGKVKDMDVDQLIVLQRSLHRQAAEIQEFMDNFRMESLEGVINTLLAKDDDEPAAEVNELVQGLTSLKSSEREKVQSLIRNILMVAKRKSKDKSDPLTPAIDLPGE